MGEPVRRRLVDDAFAEFLDTYLSFPVGLNEVPDDPTIPGTKLDTNDPTIRYGIVVPTPGGVGQTVGPPAEPEADADVEYDVRVVVGLDRGREGVQWCADEVYRVLFERTSWGAPVRTMPIAKHEEMDRSAPEGPATATLLDDVWQATLSVRLTVTRSE